jgi:hypothetical protein
MDDVAATLAAGAHGVIGQIVAGLGGVGKTEVALHHVHTCRDRYAGVWWAGADTRVNLTAGLAALAHRLVPATSVLPDEQAEAWATAWLHHHSGWLLVLDNVEEPGDVASFLARPRRCSPGPDHRTDRRRDRRRLRARPTRLLQHDHPG